MQLVLDVGVIPARFYHGDMTNGVPLRYAQAPDVERLARRLLPFGDGMRGLIRFITKTNSSGLPLSVTLIEYKSGDRRHH